MTHRLRVSLHKGAMTAALAALALSMGGCTMYSLEELRHTTPHGTTFQNELSRLYRDFADEGEKEYDWGNSWHFADKGLMLAYGKDMPPEDLKNWNIPEDALPALQKARADLMTALTPEAERRDPGDAANAQFFFDCWVKYQEANWQEDDISYCRDNFTQSLAALTKKPGAEAPVTATAVHKHKKTVHKKHALLPSVPVKPAPASEKAPEESALPAAMPETPKAAAPAEIAASESKTETKAEAKPESKAPQAAAASAESMSYIVFFEKGQAVPSDAGSKVISDIAASLQGVSGYEVVISDHGNAGSKADPVLAAQRGDVVKKMLVSAGVNAAAIKSPSAPTDKTARRRIEIFINE